MRSSLCRLVSGRRWYAVLFVLMPAIFPVEAQELAEPKTTPPRGIGLSAPAYPPESRVNGEEGVVMLRLRVLEDGTVSEAQIAESSGFPGLDAAANAHAVTWRFQPATVDGVPAAVWYDFKMKFSLADSQVVPARPDRVEKPEYPTQSRRYGEEGMVTLMLLIQADGKVGEARVMISSGSERLNESAREAARHWRFHPATADGEPIAHWQRFRVNFTLDDREPFLTPFPTPDSTPYRRPFPDGPIQPGFPRR